MSAGDNPSPENGRKGRNRPFLGLVRGTTTSLDWSGRVIVFACLVSMFFALLANVVLRYAFGSGIAWAYEIHALLLPWMVAGGLVIASARRRNIAITLLSDLLTGRALLGLNLIIQGTILVIAVSVLWSSLPILRASQFQTLSTLGIKQVWGYSSLVYAFGSMALIAAFDIVRTLAGEDIADHYPGNASLS
jgi:TRAP-type C4-dicarboxylate transport system permease small subunit